MAKKRMRTGGRDVSNYTPIANAPRVARPTVLLVTQPTYEPLGDLRRFTMDRTTAPPYAVNRNATRIVVDKFGESIRRQTKAPLRFNVPEKVAICNRRKARKEVLHAYGKAGSRKIQRRPRRSYWSTISCR